MKTISEKRFCNILENHGWVLKRITGSLHIYAKIGVPARISVPVHNNEALKPGLLADHFKTADLTMADL